jgi:hypothetical protein
MVLLYRNLLYRDGKSKADIFLPLSSYDSGVPEEQWKWMARYEQETGGEILAIPHIGDLSNGSMFDNKTLGGGAIAADMQNNEHAGSPFMKLRKKGDGEANLLLSPNDEYADYGTWDMGQRQLWPRTKSNGYAAT